MKHVVYILGILLITFLFFLLAEFAEPAFFERFPPQLPADITMEQWKTSFQHWAKIGVYFAGGASLLWYVFAQWVFKINSPQTAGKQLAWAFFFVFPIGAIVVGAFSIERAESSLLGPYGFLAMNGLLCYYLATLLFSPSSFKYAPPGASQIRRW